MMKRLSVLFISVIMLFSSALTICVAADAEPTFVVSTAQGDAGDTVTVTVSTENNPGIISLKLKVGYDSDVLELTECVGNTDVFDGVVGLTFSPIKNNPFVINWISALSLDNNTANDVIATLSFKIKQGAAVGKSDITISYDPNDVFDFNEDKVAFEVENGFVDVNGANNDGAVSSNVQNTESVSQSVNNGDDDAKTSEDTNINDTDKTQSSDIAESINSNESVKESESHTEISSSESNDASQTVDGSTDAIEDNENHNSANEQSNITGEQSNVSGEQSNLKNPQSTDIDNTLGNGDGNQTLLWVVVIALAVILTVAILVFLLKAKK